ncbi:MAG: hypothetical protein ACE5I9_04530 [Candidatus Methylomirabilales bacterium]
MRHAALGLLLLSLMFPACSTETSAPAPALAPPAQVATAPAPKPSPPPSRTASAEPEPAVYNPRGRRDPFVPLVQAQTEEGGVDIRGLKLAGIVWQKDRYFALLEAPDGLGHILKVNDRLGPNARVKAITKDTVLIEMKRRDVFGKRQLRTIRLELKKEEEEKEKKKEGEKEKKEKKEGE